MFFYIFGTKFLINFNMRITHNIIFSAIAIAFFACAAEEDCSDFDAKTRYPLSDFQKNFGDFKHTHRYIHSDGYEFSLSTIQDTTYWKDSDRASPCIDGKEEIREIKLASDYPVFYAQVTLRDNALSIYIRKESFYARIDSSESTLNDYWDEHVNTYDSLEINGVTYKNVFEISHDNDENKSISSIFVSKKAGIIKIKLKDEEFSLVEPKD